MKKIILSIALISTLLMSQDELENPFLGDDNFPMGYSLVYSSMPNFMHLYMKGGGMHKLNLTPKQEEAIEEVFSTRPRKVMQAAIAIKHLETKLAIEVVDGGKEVEEVQGLLDSIAQKRKEMAMLQIGCMKVFKEVLTKEQYKILRDMAIEEAEDL